jgi:hypothetical protein
MTATLGRHLIMRWRRRPGEASARAWPDLVVAWGTLVEPELGAGHQSFADHAADLLESLEIRPSLSSAALERFGRVMGNDGWPIEDVSRWLVLLTGIAPRYRKVLDDAAADTALARGWTAGFVRGARERAFVDPTTGLCTSAVLEVRLRQVYEQCRSVGVPTHLAYALAVVDPGRSGSLVGSADGAVLGLIVSTTFRSGETCAALARRIAVLAPRTGRLVDQLDQVASLARDDHLVRHGGVLTWVDQLPESVDQVSDYLVDLAR